MALKMKAHCEKCAAALHMEQVVLPRIEGTGGDDVLLGTTMNDNLRGNSGNDLIKGGFGNDRILGNDGDDEIHGSQHPVRSGQGAWS